MSIKFIEDLLSYFDIGTTERYLHITKDKLITVINPLDELFKRMLWERLAVFAQLRNLNSAIQPD